jgi:hypothetical protein
VRLLAWRVESRKYVRHCSGQGFRIIPIIVGHPDPQDSHVFGPPGSGSISQRYGSGKFHFLIKDFNTKF